MKDKNTVVKIEAHGHLGDFSMEYHIYPEKEFAKTAQIFREFFGYVRKGYLEKWDKLFQALAELEKLEKGEAEKDDC